MSFISWSFLPWLRRRTECIQQLVENAGDGNFVAPGLEQLFVDNHGRRTKGERKFGDIALGGEVALDGVRLLVHLSVGPRFAEVRRP